MKSLLMHLAIIILLANVSCKKAKPEKASDNILAKLELVQFTGSWTGIRTGTEIGYEMKIYLYKDKTFKKEYIKNENTTTLIGAFKETTVGNQTLLQLYYAENISRAGEAVTDNVFNNVEVLQYITENELVSGSTALDGNEYTYEKN